MHAHAVGRYSWAASEASGAALGAAAGGGGRGRDAAGRGAVPSNIRLQSARRGGGGRDTAAIRRGRWPGEKGGSEMRAVYKVLREVGVVVCSPAACFSQASTEGPGDGGSREQGGVQTDGRVPRAQPSGHGGPR